MSACFCLIKSSALLWTAFTSSGVLRPMRPFAIFPDLQGNVGAVVRVFYGTFCWGAGYHLPLSCQGGSFIICLTLKWIPRRPSRCRRPGSQHMGNLHRLSVGTVERIHGEHNVSGQPRGWRQEIEGMCVCGWESLLCAKRAALWSFRWE